MSSSTAQPPVFLTSNWLKIVMANFRIDPTLIEPHVPPGTELDCFDGSAWISVVGLLFDDTRLLGLPIPLHRNFEEINLRIYVRRAVGDDTRRAVTFIKELVPLPAVTWTARLLYGENYQTVPVRHETESDKGAGSGSRALSYVWGRGATQCRLSARIAGEAQSVSPGSEEAFIAEHEWGYSRRKGSTFEYRVEHPPWRIWRAQEVLLEGNLSAHYGAGIGSVLKQPPDSAFVAEGSAVKVYRGVKISAP